MLVLGTVIVASTWGENYGNQTTPFLEQLQKGFAVIKNQREVAIAGACQSSFEGAMYTFVFMWTVALEKAASDVGMGI